MANGMAGNPFYVDPSLDISQGLQGLNTGLGIRQERLDEQREKDRKRSVLEGAAQVYKSGDPMAIAEFALQNPEVGEELNRASKFRSEETKENYFNTAFKIMQSPENAEEYVKDRQAFLSARGVTDSQQTDTFLERYNANPERALKELEADVIFRDAERYKNYKEAIEVEEPKTPTTAIAAYLQKYPEATADEIIDFTQKLKKTADKKKLPLSPEGKVQYDITEGFLTKEQLQANLLKKKDYAPTGMKKYIEEQANIITQRQELLDQGMPEDDPRVKELQKFIDGYDVKITGTEINPVDVTDEQVDVLGAMYAYSGKMPSLGRGKPASVLRARIVKSAAIQGLGGEGLLGDDTSTKSPSEAAFAMIGATADTKAIQSSLTFLDKQMSSMGSFTENMDFQIGEMKELAKDLKTFDTRLLNIPLRFMRGKIIGTPLQSKWDMYLTEIEQEMGKLATGSTASVAELSTSAQERWDKIHDKNLSVGDTLELLAETNKAAKLRRKSIQNQLGRTRKRMRDRDYSFSDNEETPNIITVVNPDTNLEETWNLDTEEIIK